MSEVILRLNDDGTLTQARAELFALAVADGLEPNDAWRSTFTALPAKGEPNSGHNGSRRRAFEASPLFKNRVALLKAEKDRLVRDDVWGQAMWMINACYRRAAVVGDLDAMLDAAKTRVRIAEKAFVPPETTESTETPAEPGSVGKPTVKNPQNKRDIETIRRELISKGLKKVPISDPEDDEEAA